MVQAQEWSHYIEAATVDEKGKRLSLSVPEESVEPLCARLNLHGIERLDADLLVKRNPVNKFIQVSGKIAAVLDQKCVVTTEAVAESVEEEFDAWFAEPNQAVSFEKAKRERMTLKEQEDQPMLEEHEDPDPTVDGKIDLGEVIVQYLSLALNPYPRKDGAVFESAKTKGLDEAPEGMYNNPFAALKEWKKNEGEKEK